MELINLKCTTAICQSTVKNLKELTNQADLLISAVPRESELNKRGLDKKPFGANSCGCWNKLP